MTRISNVSNFQMKRAALYARISITDPNTPKVAIQLDDLRKLAAARGYTVACEYADDGLSALKAENRPDFDRLLAELAAGTIDVILATEESRLARNGLEKNMLMLACVQAGATWETVRDGAVDPATASGSFMASIRGAVDSFESQRKSERQKSANSARRASGRPTPGQRPFGWLIDQMTPVPEEAALIRQGIDMILSGAKPYAVTKAWNASGIKTGRGKDWSSTSVVSVLKRWRNAGWTCHDDEPIAEAQWPAVCTREELETVRAVLAVRAHGKGWRKPTGLCSGIARCVCGDTLLTTGYADARMYRCATIAKPGAKTGRHVSIQAAQLDPLAAKALVGLYLQMPYSIDTGNTEAAQLAHLHTSLAAIRQQQATLLDLHLSGDVPKSLFAKKNADLTKRSDQTTEAIARIGRASAHAQMLLHVRQMLTESTAPGKASIAGAVADAEALTAKFQALTLEEQRRLVSASLSISVSPGRTLGRVSVNSLLAPEEEFCEEFHGTGVLASL